MRSSWILCLVQLKEYQQKRAKHQTTHTKESMQYSLNNFISQDHFHRATPYSVTQEVHQNLGSIHIIFQIALK